MRNTIAQRIRGSLGYKDCCANTNSLTYLLTLDAFCENYFFIYLVANANDNL